MGSRFAVVDFRGEQVMSLWLLCSRLSESYSSKSGGHMSTMKATARNDRHVAAELSRLLLDLSHR